MTAVSWANQPVRKTLHFVDLLPNEAFRIKSYRSKGAVYIKVVPGHDDLVLEGKWGETHSGVMYELATGKLYPPTSSTVELVDVDIEVHQDKPDIY